MTDDNAAPAHHATVTLAFRNKAEAGRAAAALEPDNDGHLDARVEGRTVVLETASGSALGLLRSLDDALGCVRAMGFD